jgi:hypothetical protein
LGYDTGGVDAELGTRSRRMIAIWQKRHGMPDTGFLTAAQVAVLQRQGEAALPRRDAEAAATGDDQAPTTSLPPVSPVPAPAATAVPVAAIEPPRPSPTTTDALQGTYQGSGRMMLYGGTDPSAFAEYTLSLTVSGRTISGAVTRYCSGCGPEGGAEKRSFTCPSAALRAQQDFSLSCNGIYAWGTLQSAKVHYSTTSVVIPLSRVQ